MIAFQELGCRAIGKRAVEQWKAYFEGKKVTIATAKTPWRIWSLQLNFSNFISQCFECRI